MTTNNHKSFAKMRLVVPLLAASVAGFGVLPPPAKPSLAKIAALANTCVYRLSPYLVDALGGLEFVNRTYCEPMRLAGWDIVESYSAASVDGDVEDRCGCFAPLGVIVMPTLQ